MMHDAKRTRVFVVAALGLFIFLAIAIWQKDTLWFSKPPPPRQKISLAVTSTYIGSGLLYLALDQAYFAQQGLDVTFIPYTSGRDALNAALGQRADLATSANIPIMFSAMQDLPVSIVATIFTASRDHGIVARHDRGIEHVSELRGKRVGVTLQSDSHFILSTMLAREQATLNDVQVVSMAPEAMVAALQTGTVDAISTWEPMMTAANKALGKNASEFRVEGGYFFDFNLVGRRDWTAAHPGQLQKLIKALLAAKQYADENPQAARQIVVKRMHMDPTIFNFVDSRYRFVVQLDQNLLIMLEDQTRWAIQAGLTTNKTMPDYLSAIDMRHLTAVKPDAVTIVR